MIPNWNDAHHLSVIVDEYNQQHRPPDQIVIVDDGSTDNSLETIGNLQREYDNITPSFLSYNQGPCVAVNHGMNLVTSEFVALTSANDRIKPGFLKKLVGVLESHPEAGLCFCDPGEVHELPDQTEKFIDFGYSLSKSPQYFARDALTQELARRSFTFPTNAVVYRSNAVHEAGGLRLDLAYHADWFLTHFIALRYGVCYVPENLAYYRIHKNSYSLTHMQDKDLRTDILRRVLEIGFDDEPWMGIELKKAHVFPEYAFNLIPFLLREPNGRNLVSLPFLLRILIRSSWSYVRPLISPSIRKQLRWLLGPKLK